MQRKLTLLNGLEVEVSETMYQEATAYHRWLDSLMENWREDLKAELDRPIYEDEG